MKTTAQLHIVYAQPIGNYQFATSWSDYNFDCGQTALLKKILPLINEGRYDEIKEVIDEQTPSMTI